MSTRKLEKGTEKYSMRETFKDFFVDRGCIFFVRPVNEEVLLQKIETLDKETLRPEFLESLEEFKNRISNSMVPKTFGGKSLNGLDFLRMVEEILVSFNDKETPQLKGVIDRMREGERRTRMNELQGWVDEFLHSNPGKEDLVEDGVSQLFNMTIGKESKDLELETYLLENILFYFIDEKKGKEEYEKIIRTKLLNKALENVKSSFPELEGMNLAEKIIEDESLSQKRFMVNEIYSSIFKKVLIEEKNQGKKLLGTMKEQLREKLLDLEHEQKKAEMAKKEAQDWRKAVNVNEEESEGLRNKLKAQHGELEQLRKANEGEGDLVLQLEILTSQNTELKRNNAKLKSMQGGGGPMDLNGMLENLENGHVSEEVRMMVKGMREELVEENASLTERFEQMGHRNQTLKMEITDITSSKNKEIRKYDNATG